MKFAATIILFGALSSCSIKQKDINYGRDNCHYCKMLIVDKQHASEVVTQKGKVYVYDAIECMLNEMAKKEVNKYQLHLTNVYNTPAKLYNAQECSYLISKRLPSPMGEYLTAFKTKELALKTKNNIGGEIYNWNAIKEKFNVIN
ncbi:MAG: nitrous oxide reductase accessory protein NosL [Flavobacteriales bacterium]|nr:nitrous oxide reductase accessory protein NosL [Flavobacteriales bacterium]